MTTPNRLLPTNQVASLAEYESGYEGGHARNSARHQTADSIIARVERSGLRGRGGAGFPTGRKWRTVASNPMSPVSVVVNGAEGEPGTYKDRLLLRMNPYLVLEGAAIAAAVVEAPEIVIAVKASFTHELDRLQRAIEEVSEAGWTDGRTVRIVEGPGEYLFGEETALLEVIEGNPPFPRVTPPYRHGLDTSGRDVMLAPPTLVDNVETLANIPGILRHGSDWFRSVGTEKSPGTILCTVTGDIAHHGVAEVAMGTTLRDVLQLVGGEVPDIGAVLMGVSSPPLGSDDLDVALTYEDLAAVGSGLGSASFIVVGADRSMRDVAAGVARFLSIESCGQCTPCKHDGMAIAAALKEGADARPRLGTVARGARCALAGQTERVVGRLLDLAERRSERPTGTPFEIVPLIDITSGRARLDASHLHKRPDWSFEGDEHDSHQDPAQRYANAEVTIRPAHVPERAADDVTDVGVAVQPDDSDPFASLHRSHTHIEALLSDLRSADYEQRDGPIERLVGQLNRHRDAVERFVYPLVERLDPDVGTDVAWYPIHHDHHARRLLERLDQVDHDTSIQFVDEVCADVHASLIEIDRRVLPFIGQHADSNSHLGSIASGIATALDAENAPSVQ